MTFLEILKIEDEGTRKHLLNNYEMEKRACNDDSSGIKCSSCKRRGTSDCFEPDKEKREGWKWSN